MFSRLPLSLCISILASASWTNLPSHPFSETSWRASHPSVFLFTWSLAICWPPGQSSALAVPPPPCVPGFDISFSSVNFYLMYHVIKSVKT